MNSAEKNKDVKKKDNTPEDTANGDATAASDAGAEKPVTGSKEHGGAKGLEPTRYGDWEHGGRCTDF